MCGTKDMESVTCLRRVYICVEARSYKKIRSVTRVGMQETAIIVGGGLMIDVKESRN